VDVAIFISLVVALLTVAHALGAIAKQELREVFVPVDRQ
jgi:hypothetical protein